MQITMNDKELRTKSKTEDTAKGSITFLPYVRYRPDLLAYLMLFLPGLSH